MKLTDVLRNTDNRLEVATLMMKKKGSHPIILSGAMHAAHPKFWDTIRQVIYFADTANYDIHLERIKNSPEGHVFSEDDKKKLDRLNLLGKQGTVIMKLTGLHHQNAELQHQYDKFGSVDLSVVDALPYINSDEDAKSVRRASKLLGGLGRFGNLSGKLMLFLFRNLPILYESASSSTTGDSLAKVISEEFVIGMRNRHAVEQALASTKNGVYMFWGAAHLPGMVDLLKAEGYTVAEKTWTTVIPADYKAPRKVKL